MPKPQVVAERVRVIKQSSESKLGMVSRVMPEVIAKKDALLAHANVRMAALACLRYAMVSARYDKDYAVAKQYCGRGADYADTLNEFAAQGLTDTPWSGLYVLFCSLMAGRFDKAEQVARWMLQCPIVAEDNADPHDPLAMLSAYTVLDMREKFEGYRRERYDTSWHAKHPFFGSLSVYLDLWRALLSRDQAAFDTAMERREQHCIRQSKERGDGRLDFGGAEASPYTIDFMGVGSSVLARHRGLSCEVDTIYLPRAMVDLAST